MSKTEQLFFKLFLTKTLYDIFLCGHGSYALCRLQSITIIPRQKGLWYFIKAKLVTDPKTNFGQDIVITNTFDYHRAMKLVIKKRENSYYVNKIATEASQKMTLHLQKALSNKFIHSKNITLHNMYKFQDGIDFSAKVVFNPVDDSYKNVNSELPETSEKDIKDIPKVSTNDDRDGSGMAKCRADIAKIPDKKVLKKTLAPKDVPEVKTNLEQVYLADYWKEVVQDAFKLQVANI